MATTHALTADTRMEDLPGLASGDTIALGGHVLTCESDLSAITGLYATGTGTIRLLDGANCDFSGSNPLPSTVTIEGGTEANPLPAHGDYGYVGRAAAVLNLRADSTFAGNVVIHCTGNSSRVQGGIVVSSTSSKITLDRPTDWEAGDIVMWATGPQEGSRKGICLSAVDPAGSILTHAANVTVPVGALCTLATAGFVIRDRVSLSGKVHGGEVGFFLGSMNLVSHLLGASIQIDRITFVPSINTAVGVQSIIVGQGTTGRVGIVCTQGFAAGVQSGSGAGGANIGPIDIGEAYACGTGHVWSGSFKYFQGNIRVAGGVVKSMVAPTYNRAEYIDVELPATLYTSLTGRDELVIRTTTPPHPTCVVHRTGGIATRVDRTDIEVSTSLPDAWRLDPIGDGTAWHDVPMTVLPGKTLSCIWYWMLGEEGATAGCQILDGEGPGWGNIAMNPGMAEVLAETAAPVSASPLRPFVTVPISWRNPSREIRKVVLRGWARGGTAYSRIDPAAGGIA